MRAPRTLPLIPALALAGVLLAGCGGDTDDGADGADGANSTDSTARADEGPGSSTSEGAAEACAARLTESPALAGVGTLGEATTTAVGGVEACRAPVTGSEVGVVAVQLIDTSASAWVEGLPAALEQVLDAGIVTDEAGLAKLREAQELLESGEGLGDAAACDLFQTIVVELQGAAPGARSVVNSVPTEEAPLAVNGQACSEGSYTSIQVENPDGVRGGAVLEEFVRGALDDFHDGPL